jgi:hypothetical protein
MDPAPTISADIQRTGLLGDLNNLDEIVDRPITELTREIHTIFHRFSLPSRER